MYVQLITSIIVRPRGLFCYAYTDLLEHALKQEDERRNKNQSKILLPNAMAALKEKASSETRWVIQLKS